MPPPGIAAALAAFGTRPSPPAPSAHAVVSPPVSLSGQLQLYSLAVPTEKEGVTTTKIVFTPPSDFTIDSFVPPPPGLAHEVSVDGIGRGRRRAEGDLDRRRDADRPGLTVPVRRASPSKAGSYTFDVQQTYSDGSIVNWDGAEYSENPAATIEAKESIGGGTTSVVADIALLLAILALVAAGFALVGAVAAGGRAQEGGALA